MATIKELYPSITIENGWQEIKINCDSYISSCTFRPTLYQQLTHLASHYSRTVLAIALHMSQFIVCFFNKNQSKFPALPYPQGILSYQG